MNLRGRKPILIAAVAQAGAVLSVLAVVQLHFHLTGTDLPVWSKTTTAVISAGGIAWVFRSGRAWILFMAALPVLFTFALYAAIPVWVPAAVLVLLILVLRNVIGDRVPLYLSNRETTEKLASLLPQNRSVAVLDLGCGTGAVPLALARAQTDPKSRFVGIENAPLPFAVAWIRAAMSRDSRIEIRWGSLWDADLGGWDLVYAFLSPHPMADLFDKARSEMTTGRLFVSNSFEVPDWPPDRRLPIESGRATALLVWNMP